MILLSQKILNNQKHMFTVYVVISVPSTLSLAAKTCPLNYTKGERVIINVPVQSENVQHVKEF